MTAVLHVTGSPLLICDQCGGEDSGGELSAPDSELVWPVVAALGWSGSPFATGQHRCPECSREDIVPPPAPAGARNPRPEFTTLIHHDLDAVVITPSGDLDELAAEQLRDTLLGADPLGRHLVVDLSVVRHIDSAGLGLLVRTHQRTKQEGGIFALAAPSRFVQTVLHTMRLDTVLATITDVSAALDAIRHRGAAPAERSEEDPR